jgi:hypothetical protein
MLQDLDSMNCLDTFITGTGGSFAFPVWPGNYVITASTSRPWSFGAANSVDALTTMRHYVHLDTLLGLKLVAADVNLSYSVNTTDAFLIARRFVGLVYQFQAGDWVFTTDTVLVTSGSNTTSTIIGLITGDVNASHIPAKVLTPSLGGVQQGEVLFKDYPNIELPVSPDRAVELGSLSLDLAFDSEVLEISAVEMNTDLGELFWTAVDGRLRISWFSLAPASFGQREPMFVLRGRVLNPDLWPAGKVLLNPLSGCHASDHLGRTLEFDLNIPAASSKLQEVVLGANKPNPFDGETEIGYYIPRNANVSLEIRDALGNLVLILVDGERQAGHHLASFSCKHCPPGVYYYTLRTFGVGNGVVLTRRMVMMR